MKNDGRNRRWTRSGPIWSDQWTEQVSARENRPAPNQMNGISKSNGSWRPSANVHVSAGVSLQSTADDDGDSRKARKNERRSNVLYLLFHLPRNLFRWCGRVITQKKCQRKGTVSLRGNKRSNTTHAQHFLSLEIIGGKKNLDAAQGPTMDFWSAAKKKEVERRLTKPSIGNVSRRTTRQY